MLTLLEYRNEIKSIGNIVYNNLHHKFEIEEMFETVEILLAKDYQEWLVLNRRYVFLYSDYKGRHNPFDLMYKDICNYLQVTYGNS